MDPICLSATWVHNHVGLLPTNASMKEIFWNQYDVVTNIHLILLDHIKYCFLCYIWDVWSEEEKYLGTLYKEHVLYKLLVLASLNRYRVKPENKWKLKMHAAWPILKIETKLILHALLVFVHNFQGHENFQGQNFQIDIFDMTVRAYK